MALLVSSGLADNSRKSYARAVSRFIQFCVRYELDPFRVNESTILRFIAHLSSDNIAPSTVRVYLAGIRAWLISEGIPTPLIYSQRVKWALMSLTRSAPPPARAPPFTMSMFLKVFEVILYSYDSAHLFSAMLLGYFGCLRASEYLPAPEHPPLLPAHVRFVGSPVSYMLVSVQGSKTAPSGFELVVGCSGTHICAVCWLLHCFSIRKLPPSYPIFSLGSGAPISRSTLAEFMQQSLRSAGLEHSNFSPHSLRAGSATDAAGLGLPDSSIQQLGRWKSSAYRAYLRPDHPTQATRAKQLVSLQGHK